MIRPSHQSYNPTGGKFIFGGICLVLLAGLSIHQLTYKPVSIKAAVGNDIASGMHIGNKAPSLQGGWQTGAGGIVQRGDRVELTGYQLWRKRSDSLELNVNQQKHTVDFYERHYQDQCSDVNGDSYACNPPDNPSKVNVSNSVLGNNIFDSPYLVVGGYHPGYTDQRTGFEDKTLLLDLWLPVGSQQIEIASKDFCVDNYTQDEYGSYGHSKLSLIHGRGIDNLLIDCSKSPTECTNAGIYDCRIQYNLGNLEPAGAARPVYLASSGEPQLYEYYSIKVEAIPGSDRFYVNQFQLEILTPADESYLVASKTSDQLNSGHDVDQHNAFPISMRLPGNTSIDPTKVNYRDFEILWEAEIYVAPDPGLGCSYDDTRYIGMHDTDYPDLAQNWMKPGQRNFPPKIDIYSASRDALNQPGAWNQLNWAKELTLTFGNQGSGNNVWENIPVRFKGNKIYRFRLYNIDQRTWIQVKLPFDQMNALQACHFRPLVKVHYADVSVGGRFGLGVTSEACLDQADIDDPNSGTWAGLYAHTIPGVDSSSARYAVRVRDQISGFASNFKSNVASASPNELTFANETNQGGYFGKSRCIANYWRGVALNQAFAARANNELRINNLVKDKGAFFFQPQNGSQHIALTNSQPAQNLALRTVVYVKGDLLIEDDILNNTGGISWTAFNDIGYLMIVVKGDILIRSDVSHINAILVAYPDKGNTQQINDDRKGRIYTCYPGDTDIDNQTLVLDETLIPNRPDLMDASRDYNNSCNQKLTVNGALIAREIHLGRTYVNQVNPSIGSFVSEEINLLPEYFVGTPTSSSFNDWLFRSDSIHILPVNF